jgi:hypothetical protein
MRPISDKYKNSEIGVAVAGVVIIGLIIFAGWHNYRKKHNDDHNDDNYANISNITGKPLYLVGH